MAATGEDPKLLIALDNSAGSIFALGWALQHIMKPNDVVYVLHVSTFTATGGPVVGLANDETSKDREELRKEVAAIVRALGIDEQNVRWTLQNGRDPGPVIVDVAKDLGVTSVILSSRRLGTISGLVLGSVSSYVMSHANVPVIVINPPPATSSIAASFNLLNIPTLNVLEDLVTHNPPF
eukprot:TRINITY_DN674_c0_g1_i1.p1 TRINITY_DN674_c0_g1~~TRINITY_DN674_c0_g1_i1.p1  ORF type:complete len:180 (-),score=35.77 TRINITY_DN674_c0_g1_i1:36-575(-)